MKNKIITLLLPIALLGISVIVWMAFTIYSVRSSSDKLPLNEVWTFQADDRIISTPVLIDDQLIFRTAENIYSVNAVNGSKNWEVAAKASDITININLLGKPIVGNSQFLISEEQGNSIGIYSTKTGEKIWAVDGQVNSINAPIEVVDNIMVVTRHDGNLVIYDLVSHTELWQVALPPRSPTPIAANKDLVILGAGDVLRVYSLKDGNLLNEKSYDSSLISEITLSESNIFISYANNGDWSLSSLQQDSLHENWVIHVGKVVDHDLSVTNDYLSVFGGSLLVLDTNNGNILWKDELQKFYSAPAFHQDSLFFNSTDGLFNKEKICEVDLSKGTIVDCLVLGNTGVTQYLHLPGPVITNDLLIVPHDSALLAFRTD